MSTQTNLQMPSLDEAPRPTTKEIASEANVTPLVKQVRHRAINTEVTPSADQETNTRPRGVNVSITFGGDEQVDLVDSYLLAIKDIEESGQDAAFAAMDNLTRARLRRKLKERRSTVDTPEISNVTAVKATTPTNSANTLHRRFSDNRNL